MLKKSTMAVIFALLGVITAQASGNAPLMRVGFVTDTHVNPKPESAKLVLEAYKLFKSLNVDAVVNCGDIADRHNEIAYKNYRNAVS